MGILIGFFHVIRPEPPNESALFQHFYKHRAAFEQLKEMFEADQRYALRRVSPFGVVTQRPFFEGKPTATSDFTRDRYQQYLRLLDQVGSVQTFRVAGTPGNPTFTLWQGLWIHHYLNIDIVWLDGVPTNQVNSLDQCRNLGNGQLFYRHIDGNWYFETNMRPF